jgi:hypothetical protein
MAQTNTPTGNDLDLDALNRGLDEAKQATLAEIDRQIAMIDSLLSGATCQADIEANAETLRSFGLPTFQAKETYLDEKERQAIGNIDLALGKARALPNIPATTQRELDRAMARRGELVTANMERREQALKAYLESIKPGVEKTKILLTEKRRAIELGDPSHPLLSQATKVEVVPETYERFRERKLGELKSNMMKNGGRLTGYTLESAINSATSNFSLSKPANVARHTNDFAKIDEFISSLNGNVRGTTPEEKVVIEILQTMRPFTAAMEVLAQEAIENIGHALDESGESEDEKKKTLDWIVSNFGKTDSAVKDGTVRFKLPDGLQTIEQQGCAAKLPTFIQRIIAEVLKFEEIKKIFISNSPYDTANKSLEIARTKLLRMRFANGDKPVVAHLTPGSYDIFGVNYETDATPSTADAEFSGRLIATLQAVFGSDLSKIRRIFQNFDIQELSNAYPDAIDRRNAQRADFVSFDDATGKNSLRVAEAHAEKIGQKLVEMEESTGGTDSKIKEALLSGKPIEISSAAEATVVVGALQKRFAELLAGALEGQRKAEGEVKARAEDQGKLVRTIEELSGEKTRLEERLAARDQDYGHEKNLREELQRAILDVVNLIQEMNVAVGATTGFRNGVRKVEIKEAALAQISKLLKVKPA